MNILLCTLPEIFISKEYLPPLALGYLAAQLEQDKHNVRVIDSHIEQLDINALIKTIIEARPDVLGLTGTCHNRFNVIKVIKEVKKVIPDTFIVAGGVHFTITAEDALRCVPELDAIVLWEGEYTISRLCQILQDGGSFDELTGVAYRDSDGTIIRKDPESFIHDLDQLPMTAWHLLKLDKYQAKLEGTYDMRAIGVMSSRGCPSSCVFCSNSAWGKRSHRRRTPEHFIDEVEFLHKKYGFKGFDFWDDTLTLSKPHILGICEEINRRNLDIKWYARARVNTVNRDILTTMRDSGCVAIAYGIESGSPKVLKAIKKNITLDQIKTAIKDTVDLGMVSKNCFMFSLPQEEPDDMLMTMSLMKELSSFSPDKILNPYGLTLIYPGTELERMAKAEGKMPQDFSWNTYIEFDKSRLYGNNSTIPFYEGLMTIEQVKSVLRKHLIPRGNFFLKARRKLAKIRSFQDVTSLFKILR